MKRLLQFGLLLTALAWCVAAWAAITAGNACTNSSSGSTTVACTVTGVTAGSGLLVGTGADQNATVSGCNDGTAYAQPTGSPSTFQAGIGRLYQWRLPNAGAGSHTITCTWSTSTGNKAIFVQEAKGMATSTPDDTGNSSNTGVGATVNAPSLTTATADDILYACYMAGGTLSASPGNGYTALTIINGNGCSYKIVTGTVTQAPSWTESGGNGWSGVHAAYKPAVAGGTAPTQIGGFLTGP